MLLFKLLLTPLLVGLIGLADRRWGATVGGWLVGLPLTSAPLTLFVALELGTGFAAPMAMCILLGLVSQIMFCVTYAWLSHRVGWLGSWLVGWGAFGASTAVFQQVSAPPPLLPLVFLGVLGSAVLVLVLWPHSSERGVPPRSPAWAILGRMGIATGFVVVLSSTASLLGPRLSGLLSPLPIFSTVFAVFAHKLQGGRCAREVLRGVVMSSFANAVFFLVVAGCIERWSIAATFGGAAFSALLTQGAVLWVLRRLSTSKRPPWPQSSA